MKYYELDPEEQELHDAIEQDMLVPAKDPKNAKDSLIGAAHNSGQKTRNINIRLSERTLYRLKAKAAHEGIPYQTLVASILHKNS